MCEINLSPCARYCLLIGSQLTTWSQGNLHYIRGPIHSTKISGNFGPKLNGSVRSNRKSFEKTGPPFEVDQFSRSDRLEFWLNGLHYLFSARSRIFLPIATQSCAGLFCCRLAIQASSLGWLVENNCNFALMLKHVLRRQLPMESRLFWFPSLLPLFTCYK